MNLPMNTSLPSHLTRRHFGQLLGGTCAGALTRDASALDQPKDMPFPTFSKGINLHHLLNWPDTKDGQSKTEYVWPPFHAANYQISDTELARLRAMGFDFLRVTADPSIFLASDRAKREHLRKVVRATVTRLLGSGFKLIFDLHPVSVNPDYAPLKLVESRDSPAFRAYADLMEELARSFDDLPHDRFAFELMNEPWLDSKAEVARWQPMLEILHTRARKGSATLPLILTGAQWSSISALRQLDLRPFKGSNVIYTFHYYDPHTYTHQGVEGDEGAYLAGLQWPPAHENVVSVRESAYTRIDEAKLSPAARAQTKEATHKLLADYELTAHDRQRMTADFESVARWAKTAGIPPQRIFLGEFGCVNTPRKTPMGEDRTRWLRAVRDSAQEFGFAWALWAYKGYGGMALFDDKGRLDKGIAEALELKE